MIAPEAVCDLLDFCGTLDGDVGGRERCGIDAKIRGELFKALPRARPPLVFFVAHVGAQADAERGGDVMLRLSLLLAKAAQRFTKCHWKTPLFKSASQMHNFMLTKQL